MNTRLNLSEIIGISGITLVFKIGFLIFSVIYFLFSLIVIRQVNLMAETVITEGSIILKVIALLHALLALGVIVLFVLIL